MVPCEQFEENWNTIGGKHGLKDRRESGQVPGRARHHKCWNEVEQRLVAEPVEPQDSPPELAPVRSHGEGLQLRRGVQETRPQGSEERSHRAYDGQPRLVAGGFRPLWGAL